MALSPHTRRISEARRVADAAISRATAARAGEPAAPGADAVRTSPPGAYDPEDEMSDLLEPLGEVPKRPSKLKLAWKGLGLLRAAKKGWTMEAKSWKTSAGGCAGILGSAGVLLVYGAAYLRGDAIQWEAVSLAVTTLASSVGLLFARDNNVTSEQAGAK